MCSSADQWLGSPSSDAQTRSYECRHAELDAAPNLGSHKPRFRIVHLKLAVARFQTVNIRRSATARAVL